jgi:CRP/FNR family transcriptional regulator, cyclic AMP receptor protein
MPASRVLGEFVAGHGRQQKLRVGEMLFHEGDVSTSVYACLVGRLNLSIATPSGREVILGTKVPVQGFGELSAIDQGPRSATARAMESSVVAVLSGDDFLDSLEQVPTLALGVLRELADQLRRSGARVAAQSSERTTERVGHLLIDLTAKFRRHGSGPASYTLPITQDEIAAWVGSSREATARSLATFRRAGAVTTERNRVTITDTACLLRVMAESSI